MTVADLYALLAKFQTLEWLAAAPVEAVPTAGSTSLEAPQPGATCRRSESWRRT